MMRDAGVRAGVAAGYAAATGPAAIAGRLLGGYALDHLPARLVAGIAFALPVLLCVIFLHYRRSAVLSTAAVVATGASLSIEGDIVAYVTARYLGLRHYELAYALLFGFYALGAGLAPVLAGAVFDASGS